MAIGVSASDGGQALVVQKIAGTIKLHLAAAD